MEANKKKGGGHGHGQAAGVRLGRGHAAMARAVQAPYFYAALAGAIPTPYFYVVLAEAVPAPYFYAAKYLYCTDLNVTPLHLRTWHRRDLSSHGHRSWISSVPALYSLVCLNLVRRCMMTWIGSWWRLSTAEVEADF